MNTYCGVRSCSKDPVYRIFWDSSIDVVTASDSDEYLSLVKTINFDITNCDTHLSCN